MYSLIVIHESRKLRYARLIRVSMLTYHTEVLATPSQDLMYHSFHMLVNPNYRTLLVRLLK